jgi:hypothetical protein
MSYPDMNQPQVEDDPEAERLVSEIEETRSEMGATINQIGHRLQPQTIADEAREKIREATVGKMERMVDDAGRTASRTSTTLMDTVRQNPVPAAMAAMGIGWLAMRMRGSSGNGVQSRYVQSGRYDVYGGGYGSSYGGSYGGGSYGGNDQSYGGHGGDGGTDPARMMRDAANQATGTAKEVADQAARRAQQVGSDVQQVAQSAVTTAQDTVQQAQWQFDRSLSQNPLAMGALALGVGAAVGLALPETRKERDLYAQPAQQLMSKATDAASQALDQAQSKAAEVGEQLTSQQQG